MIHVSSLNNLIKKKTAEVCYSGSPVTVIGPLFRETDTVLKKTVDTHTILINAIKFYVCLQEI